MTSLRAIIEPRIQDFWGGGGGASRLAVLAVAAPAQALYGSAVALGDLAYRRGFRATYRVPIPVISVGNLVVGGTGKTPVSAWLARRLRALGARPAVLLRGYGMDEPLLHRRWNPGVPVLVGRDRLQSARLAAEQGSDAAVLDDGFQHRRLARDLDLVLVAAEQPFPGALLPAGPYREGAGALSRADLVAVTRRTASDARVEEVLARVTKVARDREVLVLALEAAGWTDLMGAPADVPRGPLLAVAALARPREFAKLAAERTGEEVELLAFPDHHAYGKADAARIVRAARGRMVVTTEKDAVKLALLEPSLPPVRVLALTVRLQSGETVLDERLERTLERYGRPAARAAGPGQGEGA